MNYANMAQFALHKQEVTRIQRDGCGPLHDRDAAV
jgi:hypothetical protein